MKTSTSVFSVQLELLRVRLGSPSWAEGMPGALAKAGTGEMGYLPTGGGHWWGSVCHQK